MLHWTVQNANKPLQSPGGEFYNQQIIPFDTCVTNPKTRRRTIGLIFQLVEPFRFCCCRCRYFSTQTHKHTQAHVITNSLYQQTAAMLRWLFLTFPSLLCYLFCTGLTGPRSFVFADALNANARNWQPGQGKCKLLELTNGGRE